MCLFGPGLSVPMSLCYLAPSRNVFPMINLQCPSGWLVFAGYDQVDRIRRANAKNM